MNMRELTLNDLSRIARLVTGDEQAIYTTLTGRKYDPAQVACELFFECPGPKWCMADAHGDAIVAVGYTRMQPGVFRSWWVCTPDAWIEHGEAVTQFAADIVSGMLTEMGAHRLETVTLASQSKAHRWYNRIGLRYESTMDGYGTGGEPAVMYVATRNVERI